MARTLRFSFDFISPYAYLAWARLHDFAARHRLDLELEPVLFAALLDAWGHKGQDSIPHIERFLRGEDPAGPEVVAQWASLPAQAHRS